MAVIKVMDIKVAFKIFQAVLYMGTAHYVIMVVIDNSLTRFERLFKVTADVTQFFLFQRARSNISLSI